MESIWLFVPAALAVAVIVYWMVWMPRESEEVEPEMVLPSDDALKKMTKAQIEVVGRDFGVELDKRKTKANMIADLKNR